VRLWIASRSRGSTRLNGQNTFGVDVLEGVPEVYGLFNGGVTLVSELSVFILKVCDKQVKFSVVHTQSSSAGGT
jgi:hypothetical protein